MIKSGYRLILFFILSIIDTSSYAAFFLKCNTPEDVIQDIRSRFPGRKVVTFLGNSGVDYKDTETIQHSLEVFLMRKGCIPSFQCIVMMGSQEGIGVIAPIAKSKGITVVSVVNENGYKDELKSAIKISENLSVVSPDQLKYEYEKSVDYHYSFNVLATDSNGQVVIDPQSNSPKIHWGGYLDAAHTILNPITETIVRASDSVFMASGGRIGKEELEAMVKAGKEVHFLPVAGDPDGRYQYARLGHRFGDVYKFLMCSGLPGLTDLVKLDAYFCSNSDSYSACAELIRRGFKYQEGSDLEHLFSFMDRVLAEKHALESQERFSGASASFHSFSPRSCAIHTDSYVKEVLREVNALKNASYKRYWDARLASSGMSSQGSASELFEIELMIKRFGWDELGLDRSPSVDCSSVLVSQSPVPPAIAPEPASQPSSVVDRSFRN